MTPNHDDNFVWLILAGFVLAMFVYTFTDYDNANNHDGETSYCAPR